VTESQPRADRPYIPDYGLPGPETGLLDWSDAVAKLTESMHYWLATTDADGGPHVNAIWGVWLDGHFYCGGGPDVRWARNLKRDPRLTLHLEDGEKVIIVKGTVDRTSDVASDVQDVIDAYKKKYDFPHPAPFWRFTPKRAFGWTDFTKNATRWSFD
jgi:hypothetical protein